MIIHITDKKNIKSIKERGLIPKERIREDVHNQTGQDKDKVSAFKLKDNCNRQTIEELRKVVAKGKSVTHKDSYKEEDLIVLEIIWSTDVWELEEKPAEMYPPFFCLPDNVYEEFEGYVQTKEIIPWKYLKIHEI